MCFQRFNTIFCFVFWGIFRAVKPSNNSLFIPQCNLHKALWENSVCQQHTQKSSRFNFVIFPVWMHYILIILQVVTDIHTHSPKTTQNIVHYIFTYPLQTSHLPLHLTVNLRSHFANQPSVYDFLITVLQVLDKLFRGQSLF